MHRQKVAEVEKLTQTVRELEEAVLAGGAAANAVRDYQRKFQEMNVTYPHFHKVCQNIESTNLPTDGRRCFLAVSFRKSGRLLTGSLHAQRLQQTELPRW